MIFIIKKAAPDFTSKAALKKYEKIFIVSQGDAQSLIFH
jgi:hypothetical protein